MMSSFSASFTPSARLCSRPKGPTRFGPGRDCIRATTRRSAQIISSVATTQEHEDQQGLAEHDPAVVLREVDDGVVRALATERRREAPRSPCRLRWPSRRRSRPSRCRRRRRRASRGRRSVAEFVGSHTTPSGMSVTTSGTVTAAAVGATVTSSRPRPSPRRSPRTAGRRPVRGPRQVRLAVLQPAGVQQQRPGREHRLAAAGRRRRRLRRRRRRNRGAAVRCPPRRRARRARRARASVLRRPRNSPASAASMSSTRRSGSALLVERRAERPPAALPVEERAGLLGRRRDRADDVARAASPRSRGPRG